MRSFSRLKVKTDLSDVLFFTYYYYYYIYIDLSIDIQAKHSQP
jgi:hypothetical protein